MRFALTAEQRQFAASLHDALARPPGWHELAELGVTALAVPDDRGGLGAAPVDLVVAFEELGHHAVPGPLVESLAAVPTLLARLDDRKWLPAMASGDLVATMTCPPHVPYAVDADTADLVLAVAPDSVRLAEPTGPALSSVDPNRRLFAVVPATELASDTGAAIEWAFDAGVLACAAQLLGAGRAMLDLSVSYVKQRTQFGRPIGQFQAVKHHLADVHVGLELARPVVFGAAVTMTRRDVSAAKIAAGRAAYRAARAALQVHGAIGYTMEYDLSRWLTMVRALVSAWGSDAVHRARVLADLRSGP
ncbi:MAG TPA: acyl-CoA dehydrogenase family protein [Actinophytocola sp.]|uniref:acyl-CoA dehydrogenase family protein n=1 Tax=Actinophytocola sp. TaxID=1872138 RepID=UPI002DDD63DD|nr:acyl-CoA dehydrogenase family protein [Actinophytocola sp.]HEV2783403.1 acyl-CoA dehydrogenase family protein [Actinophytocola sp.]